jgi:hypothetical protein
MLLAADVILSQHLPTADGRILSFTALLNQLFMGQRKGITMGIGQLHTCQQMAQLSPPSAAKKLRKIEPSGEVKNALLCGGTG